jgi:hypothetical protein
MLERRRPVAKAMMVISQVCSGKRLKLDGLLAFNPFALGFRHREERNIRRLRDHLPVFAGTAFEDRGQHRQHAVHRPRLPGAFNFPVVTAALAVLQQLAQLEDGIVIDLHQQRARQVLVERVDRALLPLPTLLLGVFELALLYGVVPGVEGAASVSELSLKITTELCFQFLRG